MFFHLQGILYSGPDLLKAPVDLARLWMHECQRVYGDKMINDQDIEGFEKLVFEFAKKFFEVNIANGLKGVYM